MRLPNQAMPVSRSIGTSRVGELGVMPADWNLGCFGASIQNGQACVDLPFVGNVCLNLPFLPDLGSVQACARVRTSWGIPRGVCVDIRVSGSTITSQCFGI